MLCLMLSKVLTQLGNSSISKQEGCRGSLDRAVGRVLGAPKADQIPVARHPFPASGLAHPGTAAASSYTLLLKRLSLSQAASMAVNELGVVSHGHIVPCSCCPSSRASVVSHPRMMWYEKHREGAFCLSPLVPDVQGEHVQGILLSMHSRTEGQPLPLHS